VLLATICADKTATALTHTVHTNASARMGTPVTDVYATISTSVATAPRAASMKTVLTMLVALIVSAPPALPASITSVKTLTNAMITHVMTMHHARTFLADSRVPAMPDLSDRVNDALIATSVDQVHTHATKSPPVTINQAVTTVSVTRDSRVTDLPVMMSMNV
jgi:hypothetical protein